MVDEGLYDRGYLVDFGNTEVALYRTPISYISGVNDEFYTIKSNETLFDIAREKFGNSSMWFILADVNSDVIEDVFDLPVGETIVIPNVTIIQSNYANKTDS